MPHTGWMHQTGESIGERFATSPNALNFLRLAFAVEVIAWHSYTLRGDEWLPRWAESVMGQIGVDCFFAISGFLITRSWFRSRDPVAYLKARARRIFPGLWVCLILTAFVIAPLASRISGNGFPTLRGQLAYVLGNSTSWILLWNIDGTPAGTLVHDPGWNGSLWTLGFEAACYLIVALLGSALLLRGRVMLGLIAGFWMLLAAHAAGWIDWDVAAACARFGVMFALGAALWLYRDKVPFGRGLAAVSVACLLLCPLLPDYRLLAAPALTYLCIAGSLWLARWPRLVLTNDLSYGTYIYAFPLQQAMLMVGLNLSWPLFFGLSVLATIPAAAASWFLLERRFIKKRASVSPFRRTAAAPAGSGRCSAGSAP